MPASAIAAKAAGKTLLKARAISPTRYCFLL
jgi:hypothetical protein